MSGEDSQDTGGLSPQYHTYERQKCFIAYNEQAGWSDDLLSACREVLSRPGFNLEPDYARKHFYPDVPLRQKALELIANARYGIYDLSYRRDERGEWQMPRNVFIELGMAIALNRPTLLLRYASNRELELPESLKSVRENILEFSGETTLKRVLEKRLPQWVNAPPDRDWWNRYCIFGGRTCEFREAHPRARQWGRKMLRCHISDGPDVDRDDFRGVVEEVLGRFSDVAFDYLDALSMAKGYDFLLCAHCQTVRSTPFAIYRITPHTPAETFMAVGMSIALEAQFDYRILKILFAEKVQEVPLLLSGYEVLEARNDGERKVHLRKFMPMVIHKVREMEWRPRPLPFSEVQPCGEDTFLPVESLDMQDLLHGQPVRDEVRSPVTTPAHILPFDELSWDNFVRLCARVVASRNEVVDCHHHRAHGEPQAGTGILVNHRTAGDEPERWYYLCLRWRETTSSDLRHIVRQFEFDADHYVILVPLAATAAMRQMVSDMPHVDLWDAEDISNQLKLYPEMLEDFFGTAWRTVLMSRVEPDQSSDDGSTPPAPVVASFSPRPKPYLLFDAGGTLVFPDQSFLVREASVRGIELTEAQLFSGYYRLIHILDCQAQKQGGRFPALWPRGYAFALFETLGIVDPATDAVAQAFNDFHRRKNLWTFTFDWVRNALSNLAAQGNRMSVISNSDGRTAQVFNDLGLAHYFEHIFDSSVLGVEKPNPAIFQWALAKLNVSPANALYIGETFYVDILGANLAGLGGIHLDPLHLYAGWPGVHLRDVRDLPAWLSRLDAHTVSSDFFPFVEPDRVVRFHDSVLAG